MSVVAGLHRVIVGVDFENYSETADNVKYLSHVFFTNLMQSRTIHPAT